MHAQAAFARQYVSAPIVAVLIHFDPGRLPFEIKLAVAQNVFFASSAHYDTAVLEARSFCAVKYAYPCGSHRIKHEYRVRFAVVEKRGIYRRRRMLFVFSLHFYGGDLLGPRFAVIGRDPHDFVDAVGIVGACKESFVGARNEGTVVGNDQRRDAVVIGVAELSVKNDDGFFHNASYGNL